MQWNKSVENSVNGLDYPEKKVNNTEPERHFWTDDARYQNFIKEYGNRTEYSGEYKR